MRKASDSITFSINSEPRQALLKADCYNYNAKATKNRAGDFADVR